jgi:hypothetical protein
VKPLEAKNSCSPAPKVKFKPQSEQVRVLSVYSMDDLLLLITWRELDHPWPEEWLRLEQDGE